MRKNRSNKNKKRERKQERKRKKKQNKLNENEKTKNTKSKKPADQTPPQRKEGQIRPHNRSNEEFETRASQPELRRSTIRPRKELTVIKMVNKCLKIIFSRRSGQRRHLSPLQPL